MARVKGDPITDREIATYPIVALSMTAAATFGALVGWAAVIVLGILTLVALVAVVNVLRHPPHWLVITRRDNDSQGQTW